MKYLPPEALRKRPNAVAPSWDIWACGCILFVMVTGFLPFNGSSEREIVRNICRTRHEFPSNKKLSKEIKDLINEMLRKDPK